MRDVLIIFVVLLVILIIISTMGGSIRHLSPTPVVHPSVHNKRDAEEEGFTDRSAYDQHSKTSGKKVNETFKEGAGGDQDDVDVDDDTVRTTEKFEEEDEDHEDEDGEDDIEADEDENFGGYDDDGKRSRKSKITSSEVEAFKGDEDEYDEVDDDDDEKLVKEGYDDSSAASVNTKKKSKGTESFWSGTKPTRKSNKSSKKSEGLPKPASTSELEGFVGGGDGSYAAW
jgi:hypothetical protein